MLGGEFEENVLPPLQSRILGSKFRLFSVRLEHQRSRDLVVLGESWMVARAQLADRNRPKCTTSGHNGPFWSILVLWMLILVDVSDFFFFFSARGGEGGVRGARKGRGSFFSFKVPGGGGLPEEGGRGAWRVSVGNLEKGGGGGKFFFFFGAEIPTK